MKPITSFALLCAFAAVAQGAVTDPVGYTTTTIAAAYGPGAPKTSVIAPDLEVPAVFGSTISGISGDQISLSGASFTPNSFDALTTFAVGTVYAYFIESADGYWAQITTNDAGSVTVQAGAGANFTVGEAVKVHRHVTISDYFGANNEAGLLSDSGGDPGAADNILIIDEVNSTLNTIFLTDLLGGSYATDGYEEAGNFPIYPDQGLQVVRRGLTDVQLVFAGNVDVNGRQVQVNSGLQLRPYVSPVATSLNGLNLYTGDIATGVADDGGTLDPGSADTVQVLVNGDTFTYFYTTLDLGNGPGWVDDGGNYAPDLPAGASLIINRTNPTNNSPFIWVIPAPTIAPN